MIVICDEENLAEEVEGQPLPFYVIGNNEGVRLDTTELSITTSGGQKFTLAENNGRLVVKVQDALSTLYVQPVERGYVEIGEWE